MQGKKSFILYCDLIKVVEKLPDDVAGKLFKIILKYVNDHEVLIDDMLLEIAFEPIKNQLKRDLNKWENLKEKRSIAGQISAEKRKRKSTNSTHVKSVEQSSTKLNKAQHRSTNSTVNVNDNVNVTVNDTVTVNDILLKKETKGRFKPPTLSEIKNQILEKKYFSVNAESFWNFYESKNWMIGKNKMTDWKKALGGWESRNFEKKQLASTASFVKNR